MTPRLDICRVRISHPNEPLFHVHAHGCRDATNERKYAVGESWTVGAATLTAVVTAVYPPDRFDYDPADVENHDTMYADDFKVFPCVKW